MSDLPTGWALTKLDVIADIVRGVTYKKEDSSAKPREGYLPIVRATNIGGTLTLDSEMVYVPERYVGAAQRMRVGDIVVAASSGSAAVVGKSAELRQDWCGGFGAFCSVIRPSTELARGYLAYLVASPRVRDRWRDLAQGTNINNLKSGDLANTPVPIPPLAEQERIVAAIEEQLSRLDSGVEALQRVRQNLKRMRAAALAQAFRAVDAEAEKLIGKDIFPFVTSGSRGWAAYYSEDGAAFIRIGNTSRDGVDLDLSDLQMVSPPSNAEGTRTKVRPGDILISITADLGRVGVVPESIGDAYINQHIALARPIPDVLSRYIAWYLVSPAGMRQWDQLRRGMTKIGLGLDDIRAVRIPVPDMARQQVVLESIEAVWASMNWVERVVGEAEQKINRLRSMVLEAAFSGGLVPQDPTDESAFALLDLIARERPANHGRRNSPIRKSGRTRQSAPA